jgi:uncharacterized RDD family membrane protein YckC
MVDGFLLGLFTGTLYALMNNPRSEGVLTFIFTILYQWYFLTNYSGQTPGKMLMNIRVVRVGGGPITSQDAVIRTLGYALNWITLGLGWLMAFGGPNHQGLHDHIARTYVVKA